MGDQHQRHAAFALQAAQQIEDLRLDGDVKRGGGFIGDQQLRVAGDGHGNHDPLVHATRQLVWVGLQAGLRVRNTHLLKQLDGAALCRLAVHAEVDPEGLGQLKTDRKTGIEAGGRFLKNHGHIFAGQAVAFFRGQAQQVVAIKAHLAGRDSPGVGHQAHQGHHGHALSRARLANDAQHITRIQRQADALDGMQHAAARGELDGQVFDFEQGHGGASAFESAFEFGVECVTQTVAEQVESQYGDQNRQTGEGDHPPGAHHEFAGVCQHGSPFG